MFEKKFVYVSVLFFGLLLCGGGSMFAARPWVMTERRKMVEGVMKRVLALGFRHMRDKEAERTVMDLGRQHSRGAIDRKTMMEESFKATIDHPDYLQAVQSFASCNGSWNKEVTMLVEAPIAPEGAHASLEFQHVLLRQYGDGGLVGPLRLVQIDTRPGKLLYCRSMCAELEAHSGDFDDVVRKYDDLDCGSVDDVLSYLQRSLAFLSPYHEAFENDRHPLHKSFVETRLLVKILRYYITQASDEEEPMQHFFRRCDDVKSVARRYNFVFTKSVANLIFFGQVKEVLKTNNEVILLCGAGHARAVLQALEAEEYGRIGDARVELEDENRIPGSELFDRLHNFYTFCYHCGAPTAEVCSRCNIARYCCGACEDGAGHRSRCTELRRNVMSIGSNDE